MEQEGQSPQADLPPGAGQGALQLTTAPDVVELSSAPTKKRPSTMIAQAPAVLDSKGALRGYRDLLALLQDASQTYSTCACGKVAASAAEAELRWETANRRRKQR